MTQNDLDDSRRRFLLQALSSGLLVGGLGWQPEAWADDTPSPLPTSRSVFRVDGDVTVNGRRATTDTLIQAGDHVRVGKDGRLVAAVGDTALLMRANSSVRIGGLRLLVRSLRATGAILGVFGRRDAANALQIHTPTATIGIRGTGVYLEADVDKSYICTCYGKVDIGASHNPKERETITTRHHDAPRWVHAKPQDGKRITPAGFLNHSDEELMMLESLVGRTVPFQPSSGGYGDGYERPRREDY